MLFSRFGEESRCHDNTSGLGHIDQQWYKSFPIQDDKHFLVVCRYVERNALRAGLGRIHCQSAQPGIDHASPWPPTDSLPPTPLQRGLTPLILSKEA